MPPLGGWFALVMMNGMRELQVVTFPLPRMFFMIYTKVAN